jgi:transcriptional regulator
LDHGKEVPTWNYVVVHAYGFLKVVEDRQWLMNHLVRLTDIHEADSAVPWKVSDPPAEFIESMMNGIVGVELNIRRLEGKWKVSQNRTDADRKAVIEGLGKLDTPDSAVMSALVTSRRP